MSAIIDLDEGNEGFCGVTVDYWEGCQWYKRPWVINRVLRLWISYLTPLSLLTAPAAAFDTLLDRVCHGR